MNEYRKLLVLQYLNEKEEDYTIQEIFARLGFELQIGNVLLDEMINEELIEYNDKCLMTISKKGIEFLDKIHKNYFKIYDGTIFLHNILPKLKKDDIYIPSNF